MRKSRIASIVVFCLLLAGQAMANLLPMPNINGQFKKQGNKKGTASQVTVQADQVNFSPADNKAHATGNVVVDSGDQHLFCDQLELDRTIQQVIAQGNVYLDTPQEQVLAEGLTYNFNDGTGEFRDARIWTDPYQIEGHKIDKISDNYYTVTEGYLTTCDLDEPHYRFGAHRMDIYQHDRAVVHGLKVYIGTVPVMYMPYFVQDLKNRPLFTFIPGDRKEFGMFLLTTARFKAGPHAAVTMHFDSRERTGFGEGADIKYNTPGFGTGLISVYYTDEDMIAGHHFWDEYNADGTRKGPTTHHERYRVVWRHKWQIDPNTNLVMQYYKIHDYDIANNSFLKDYFPKDYLQNAQNSSYDSYALLTRNMPHGTLTFYIDTNVNPALRGIERLPELTYTLNNQSIGYGFYAKSVDTYSNLTEKSGPYSPKIDTKTMRFDSNNDISRPFKVGFISFNPHAGGENTFYSRTASDKYDVFRGAFRTQLDMTTKFYRIWDYHTNFMGLDINRLRHVITPTITYLYQTNPTVPAGDLTQYDPAIDGLTGQNQFQFGLENELQTKRDGQIVELLRVLTSTVFGMKGQGGSSNRGFNPFDTQIDFTPNSWLSFHDDNEYNWHYGHWDSQNFDTEFHGSNWSVSLGDRWTRYQGNQLTSELDYTFNPKWSLKLYGTLPIQKATEGNTTSAREYEYVLTRDLHEWQMDIAIDQMQGQGSTFYVLFRLKASPGMKLNLINTMFHASAPGANGQGVSS